MINPELKLYYDQVFQFCKSVIIKSDLMANQMKNTTLKVAGVEINNDYENPYYKNLIGEYSFLDEPIYITENGEQVVLNKTLLESKPWLKKKYNIYGKAFEKLINAYPNRESFIRCIICQPFISLDEAVNADDLTLAYYDESILDYQERTSLVETLKNFIVMFKKRWAINEFAYEELYGLSLLSIFYSQVPLYLFTQRVKNIKTRFAHTMHIWDYLASYSLSDYRSVLTIDQQLFLYRNIDYIVKNLGKHGTLAILIEKLLNQNYLTIAPKMVIDDYSYDKTENLLIKPSIVSRQFDQTPISQFFENDSMSTEQFLYILFINGFISKYDYEKYVETEEKLSVMSNTTLQTKFLELKRNFPSSPIQNFLLSMIVAGIFHFVYKNQLNYSIPIYIDEFDYSEILTPRETLLFVLYCLQKENNIEEPLVPYGVKIYPFPCNYDLIDLAIPGTEKKISDYINIDDFIERYASLFKSEIFNFNSDPIEVIVKGSKLILEDLLLASDNTIDLNIAFNLLHQQMFTYKEDFIDNNEVPLFDRPGATIKEQLNDRGMSQKEFAVRIDMSEKHVSKLINGEVQLTPEVAVRLEIVLGVPARFWNNLEAIYREKLIKIAAEKAMDADENLARQFPYSEMAKLGWIPQTRNSKEKVINLRKYFEVVSLSLLENTQITRIACRRLAVTDKSDLALLAWTQEAKIQARGIETKPINIKGLISVMPDIRKMT